METFNIANDKPEDHKGAKGFQPQEIAVPLPRQFAMASLSTSGIPERPKGEVMRLDIKLPEKNKKS